ncbi:MAG TPA: serine protease [Gaiellaceae bacterium]|nr:serine protease [Gaiellaceae bacterium]
MVVVDVLVVLWVVLFALQGAYRGLVAQALSLVGLGIGALAGSWIAPKLLSEGSPWVSIASLVGAVAGAALLGAASATLADTPRRFLAFRPGLRTADSLGGVALGAALGLGLAWLIAVVAVQQPSLGFRQEVRDSAILPRLMRAVPPDRVLQALARFDPLPQLTLSGGRLPPPDPSVLQSPGARAAAGSVVKIHGTACGLGIQGSGWVVRRDLIATNAHVIAGEHGTNVLAPNGQSLSAEVVYVDSTNDVALLRVQSLRTAPLPVSGNGDYPVHVALMGYPRDGPLVGVAGTAGAPRTVLAPNAYDKNIRPRSVVSLRGRVQPGESGGPVVDSRGGVVAMIFGGAKEGGNGFAVPVSVVEDAVPRATKPVSSGPCID